MKHPVKMCTFFQLLFYFVNTNISCLFSSPVPDRFTSCTCMYRLSVVCSFHCSMPDCLVSLTHPFQLLSASCLFLVACLRLTSLVWLIGLGGKCKPLSLYLQPWSPVCFLHKSLYSPPVSQASCDGDLDGAPMSSHIVSIQLLLFCFFGGGVFLCRLSSVIMTLFASPTSKCFTDRLLTLFCMGIVAAALLKFWL